MQDLFLFLKKKVDVGCRLSVVIEKKFYKIGCRLSVEIEKKIYKIGFRLNVVIKKIFTTLNRILLLYLVTISKCDNYLTTLNC